jgi:hydrogenase maturation protease
MSILILGVGNPILGDDSVGFHVAQEIGRKIKDKNIDAKGVSTSGLNLLEFIRGYDKVIIIDAIKTKNGKTGQIYRFGPSNLSRTAHLTHFSHNMNIATAIKIGKKFTPEQMPKEIVIFAIEVKEVGKFAQEMTERVKEAIPKLVSLVLEEIEDK